MTPARFRWGIILMQVGILILLRNIHVLTDSFWEDLLMWSPLILIAIGIEKIFTRTKLQFIAYLSSLALFAAGFAVAFNSGYYNHGGDFFSTYTYSVDDDSSIKSVKAILNLDESDLKIRDSGDDLVYSRFPKFMRKPKVTRKSKDEKLTVRFVSRRNQYLGGAIKIDADENNEWYMKFSRRVPLELDCRGRKSDIHLNLSTTPLRKLNLDADDSRVYIKLGDLEPLISVKIQGDDAKLRLRVPDQMGIRIEGDEYRAYLEKIGLIEDEGGFVNEGYDSLDSRIEIDLDSRLGSFSLDFF